MKTLLIAAALAGASVFAETPGELYLKSMRPFVPEQPEMIVAAWIRPADTNEASHTFELRRKPKTAEVLIACTGGYELFLNGESIARNPTPGRPNKEDTYFDVIPVFPLKGVNNISVRTENGVPFLLQIQADGYLLGTDESWFHAVAAGKVGEPPYGRLWRNPVAGGASPFVRYLSELRRELCEALLNEKASSEFVVKAAEYYRQTGDRETIGDLYPLIYRSLRPVRTSGQSETAAAIARIRLLADAAELIGALNRPEETAAFLRERNSLVRMVNVRYRNPDGSYTPKTETAAAVLAGLVSPGTNAVLTTRYLKSDTNDIRPEAIEALLRLNETTEALTRLPGTETNVFLTARYIAGIEVQEPGAKRFKVVPVLIDNPRFETSFESFSGCLIFGSSRTADETVLTLTVPAETAAEVHIPMPKGISEVRVDGTIVWRKHAGFIIQRTVKYFGLKNLRAVVELPSGTHQIRLIHPN